MVASERKGGSVLFAFVAFLGLGACSPDEAGRTRPMPGPGPAGNARATTPRGAAPTVETAAERTVPRSVDDTATASVPVDATGTPPFEGTVARTEHPGTVQGVATLVSVRTGRHAAFDRVVFDFAGAGVPGYQVEYVDPPARQCGSGAAMPLAADQQLTIRFVPARAHDNRGRPTIAARARTPGLSVLKELAQSCDFEGQVEWVLGLAASSEYRVLELTAPTRVVLDVRH